MPRYAVTFEREEDLSAVEEVIGLVCAEGNTVSDTNGPAGPGKRMLYFSTKLPLPESILSAIQALPSVNKAKDYC